MGLAQGGGNVGVAQATITFNTQGMTAGAAAVKSAAAGMEADLNKAGKAADKFLVSAKSLVAAFGINLGVQGIAQAGKLLVQVGLDSIKAASDLTESTNKISVAFAGSGKAVLDWSKNSATALGQSQRQALEAASSFGLLFRTMGLGAGRSAEMSQGLVQLAADMASINNISPEEALQKLRSGLVGEVEPLRSVGVLLDEATVKAKAMELGLSGSGNELTQQEKVLVRYQLILEQTSLTQGDFARTAGELANQQRTLTANLEDSEALIGKVLKPAASGALLLANSYISQQIALAQGWEKALTAVADEFIRVQRVFGGTGLTSAQIARQTTPSERTGIGSNIRQRPVAMDRAPVDFHQDWAKGMEDIQKTSDAAMLDEENSFGASRASTVANYNKSVARDEANYARGRLRANLDFLDSLAGVAKDATRREAGQAADLARTMSTTRADSVEREADARKDAAKNLAKLDEEYAKDRLKAAKDLSDNLLDAAGNLDAKQVYELQRDFAKQQEEAATAHDDARKAITDGLQERLDDEAKSLAKSLRQQQESYDRSIEEGRANDALRLQDMRDTFAKSQAREAEDHAIQVAERAADQAAQLAEMDTQHGLRLNQIRTHAIEERAALQQAADDAAIAEGKANAALVKRHEAEEKQREDLWDKFHKHIVDSLLPGSPGGPPGIAPTPGSPRGYASGGYVPRTGLALLHGGEVVIPARMVNAARGTGGRSVNIGDVNINVAGSNASAGDIGRAVREELIRVLEEAA